MVWNLLVDIIVVPVGIGGIIPFADGGCREVYDEPLFETGDEVGATDNVVGVKEPKCTLLKAGDELDSV